MLFEDTQVTLIPPSVIKYTLSIECYLKPDLGRKTMEEEPINGSTPPCHECN